MAPPPTLTQPPRRSEVLKFRLIRGHVLLPGRHGASRVLFSPSVRLDMTNAVRQARPCGIEPAEEHA